MSVLLTAELPCELFYLESPLSWKTTALELAVPSLSRTKQTNVDILETQQKGI